MCIQTVQCTWVYKYTSIQCTLTYSSIHMSGVIRGIGPWPLWQKNQFGQWKKIGKHGLAPFAWALVVREKLTPLYEILSTALIYITIKLQKSKPLIVTIILCHFLSTIKLIKGVDALFISDKDLWRLLWSEWFRANLLSLNVTKTSFIVFGNRKNLEVKLYVDNMLLERQSDAKFLGVILSSDLKWKKHVDILL